MPSYNKYLYNGMFINLILYCLITILVLVTNIFTALTIWINLFRCLFNSSCASILSKKRIKINLFIEYDILIVFTNYGIFLIRLIFMFNSSIKSVSNILFDFFYLMNMNLVTIFAFLVFILFIIFFFYKSFFISSGPTRGSMSSLFLRSLLALSTRLLSCPFFFFRV